MSPDAALPSRALLGRVLDDLGSTLLSVAAGAADPLVPIGGVVIWDSADRPELPLGAMVLGIGLRDPVEIIRTIGEIGEAKASSLVLRAPVIVDDALAQAAAAASVSVLALTRGASWIQLTAMLRSLLADHEVGQDQLGSLGGVESGDLFALANAVAALLDAPITIEDRSSRLLAFSGRQDEADAPRVEAILGRQVPESVTQVYMENGIFRDLYRSREPIWVDGDRLGLTQMPRVVMAVRAGDEVLGSIWAAVREPLSAERSAALVEAAKVVALHLLRVRAGADVERRVRSDLVSTIVQGGTEAHEALSHLGLTGRPAVLLALEVISTAETADDFSASTTFEAERARISDAFAMHVAAMQPRSASALVGSVAYALIPTTRTAVAAEQRAVEMAGEFLDRIGTRHRLIIGVGPVANSPSEFVRSRIAAERVLRVLRSDAGGSRAAKLADVHVDALLMELRDIAAARNDGMSGPIAALADYDARHRTDLVGTLTAWFDAFGDTAAAAAAIAVHPNTLRYRLRRISEVSAVDLEDPNNRLGMMLQLKLMPTRTSSTGRPDHVA
jgi:hypothetical protein